MGTGSKQPNFATVGIDIGGTNIKAVALSGDNAILSHFQTPSLAHHGAVEVKRAVHKSIQHFLQLYDVIRVGVGCAGSVDHTRGVVRNSPNFSDWKNINVAAWVRELVSVPTLVDNDANCALLAEVRMGNARGFRNVVLLTLGTGIGGSALIAGQVYRGSTGSATELGHFSLKADGLPCPCGNTGCFERYCSASALTTSLPGFSAQEIMDRRSEEPFASVVSTFKVNLMTGITSIANIYDPDCIVLGGAVSLGLTHFLDDIGNWVRRHAFPSIGNHVTLRMTKFGHQSGACGAALLFD